jgi:SAM-dependent methyltransferase
MRLKKPVSDFDTTSKLESYWGPQIWREVAGKTVVDFGCGTGKEVVEIAKHGAAHVIGLDILQRHLHTAMERAEQEGVGSCCSFSTNTSAKADVIVTTDAFEHFADPAQVLQIMSRLLKASGRILITFGPPWLHPKGGHSFSIFPWAHLLFTEKALIRWRSDFKSDGARRFSEVEGGLNQMTVKRFRQYIGHSDFCVESFESIPIRFTRPLCFSAGREFFTSIVRCKLKRKEPTALGHAEHRQTRTMEESGKST